MNKMIALLLAVSAANCGLLPEDTEVKEPNQTALGLRVGQHYASKRVQTGEAGMTYQLINGELKPCKFNWQIDEVCEQPTSRTRTAVATAYTAVSAETQIAGFDKPGILITERVTTAVEYKPVRWQDEAIPDVTTTDLYVLAERNGFVVKLSRDYSSWYDFGFADFDVTKGRALYPAHPQVNQAYTDDRGVTWYTVGTEPVTLGKRTFSAAAVTLAASDAQAIDWSKIVEQCFKIEDEYDYRHVSRYGDCYQDFIVDRKQKLWISNSLVVKGSSNIDAYQIEAYGWVNADGYLDTWDDSATSLNGDLVVFVSRYTYTETYELLEPEPE